jgi:hypothetical protein
MEPPHVGCYQLRSPHLELALKQDVFDMGNCAQLRPAPIS